MKFILHLIVLFAVVGPTLAATMIGGSGSIVLDTRSGDLEVESLQQTQKTAELRLSTQWDNAESGALYVNGVEYATLAADAEKTFALSIPANVAMTYTCEWRVGAKTYARTLRVTGERQMAMSGAVALDTRTGVRTANDVENLRYSTRWTNGASVRICQNGSSIFTGTDEGETAWSAPGWGVWTLTHETLDASGSVIATETAQFEPPTQDMTVSITDYSATYDGAAHGATVVTNASSAGATIRYGTSSAGPFSDEPVTLTYAGTKTIWYEISKPGFHTLVKSGTVKLSRKSIADATVTLGDALAYTGARQTQAVESVEIDGLAATCSYAGNTGTSVGSYTLTATGTGNFTGTVTKSWSIEPKELTVMAAAKSQVYGAAAVPLTYTTDGLVAGDALTGALTRAAGTDAGTYAIGLGTLTNANYVISFVGANYTITRASYDMSGAGWNYAGVFTYDRTVKSVSVTGLPSGVTVKALSGASAAAVGNYTATATFTYDSRNYTAPTLAGCSWQIAARPLVVVAEAKNQVYGDAEVSLTYLASGLLEGDTLTGALTREAGTDAGTYAITLGRLANSNYAITFTGADYTISPKPLTLGMATPVPAQTYTGAAIEPSVSLSDADATLTANDWQISGYESNIDPGTGYVVVEGLNNYTGTIRVPFVISSVEEGTLREAVGDAGTVVKNGDAWEVTLTNDITGTLALDGRLGSVELDLNGRGIWGESGKPAIHIVSGTGAGDATQLKIVDPNHADEEDDFGGGAGSVAILLDAEAMDDGATVTLGRSVTAVRLAVEPPVIVSVPYNGQWQTADVPASNRWSVVENRGGAAVGSYPVILALVDAINYRWATTSGANWTGAFVIYYAQVSFRVTFDANGGKCSVAENTYDVGTYYGSLPTPTRSGYLFDGWYESPTFESDTRVDRNTAVIAADVTLYAKWNRRALWYSDAIFHVEAAATWNGYLLDAAEHVKGTITVSVGKPKMTTGISAVAVALNVAGQRKVTYKGTTYDGYFASADGRLELRLGANGLSGRYAGYELDGSRNYFTAKDEDSKVTAARVLKQWQGSYRLILGQADGYATFSVAVGAKGKTTVKGNFASGTSVSISSQLMVGERECAFAGTYTKKDETVAFLVWFCEDGTVECSNLDGDDYDPVRISNARSGSSLSDGASFRIDREALAAKLGAGTLTDLIPDGLAVSMAGTKFALPKAGKVALLKDKSGVDTAKLGENPSGLKLSHTVKTGLVKGSFAAYRLVGGKLKKTTVSLTGILLDGQVHGTATVKKVGSCPFVITAEE